MSIHVGNYRCEQLYSLLKNFISETRTRITDTEKTGRIHANRRNENYI
jgi:hypothetical protein